MYMTNEREGGVERLREEYKQLRRELCEKNTEIIEKIAGALTEEQKEYASKLSPDVEDFAVDFKDLFHTFRDISQSVGSLTSNDALNESDEYKKIEAWLMQGGSELFPQDEIAHHILHMRAVVLLDSRTSPLALPQIEETLFSTLEERMISYGMDIPKHWQLLRMTIEVPFDSPPPAEEENISTIAPVKKVPVQTINTATQKVAKRMIDDGVHPRIARRAAGVLEDKLLNISQVTTPIEQGERGIRSDFLEKQAKLTKAHEDIIETLTGPLPAEQKKYLSDLSSKELNGIIQKYHILGVDISNAANGSVTYDIVPRLADTPAYDAMVQFSDDHMPLIPSEDRFAADIANDRAALLLEIRLNNIPAVDVLGKMLFELETEMERRGIPITKEWKDRFHEAKEAGGISKGLVSLAAQLPASHSGDRQMLQDMILKIRRETLEDQGVDDRIVEKILADEAKAFPAGENEYEYNPASFSPEADALWKECMNEYSDPRELFHILFRLDDPSVFPVGEVGEDEEGK